jgi:hypothetical protein
VHPIPSDKASPPFLFGTGTADVSLDTSEMMKATKPQLGGGKPSEGRRNRPSFLAIPSASIRNYPI